MKIQILFWFGSICFIFGLVGLKFKSLDLDLETELDNNQIFAHHRHNCVYCLLCCLLATRPGSAAWEIIVVLTLGGVIVNTDLTIDYKTYTVCVLLTRTSMKTNSKQIVSKQKVNKVLKWRSKKECVTDTLVSLLIIRLTYLFVRNCKQTPKVWIFNPQACLEGSKSLFFR